MKTLLVLVAIIAVAAASQQTVNTSKCRKHKVIAIPDGKLKRVAKGADQFRVKCDGGFKTETEAPAASEVVIRCAKNGDIVNFSDVPRCLKKKKTTTKGKKIRSKKRHSGKKGRNVNIQVLYENVIQV
jgi:predicted ribosome-associated RNA-binding protein Tma20